MLRKALVLSLHREDLRVLHTEWVPVFEIAIEAAAKSRATLKKMEMVDRSGCWLDYIVLQRIYKVCSMPDMECNAIKNK